MKPSTQRLLVILTDERHREYTSEIARRISMLDGVCRVCSAGPAEAGARTWWWAAIWGRKILRWMGLKP